jgi:hypothetical protein
MFRLARLIAVAVTTVAALASAPALADPPTVKVFKSATCDCCARWVEHLRAHGFVVEVTDASDVDRVKREHHVPVQASACHTALVGGYFVEGHVPAEDVERLLKEKPRIAGIAVPGMPIGSPGMEGPDPEPYDTLAVGTDGKATVFAAHRP